MLIPGIGAPPVFPDYQPKNLQRTDDMTTVNCSWGCAKYGYAAFMRLKAIRDGARRPVRFRLFPNWGLGRYNAVIPFRKEVAELLDGNVSIVLDRKYDAYMELMQQGDLSIDSYPFGGYNTILDSLHVGKPIVTYEGTRFYNRAASAVLRRLGLDELIAVDERQYVEKTIRLIDDDDYRRRLSDRLREMDLKALLYDAAEPACFGKAVDHLIDNHESLRRDGTRQPIFIR